MRKNKLTLIVVAVLTLTVMASALQLLSNRKAQFVPEGDLLQTLVPSKADYLKHPTKKIKGPCVVLFIASWCPHCHEILADLKGVNLPIWIVLYHDRAPLTDKQKQVAQGVFRDVSLSLSPKWHVKSIPSLFIINSRGEVDSKFDGSFRKKGQKKFKESLRKVQNA